MLVDSGADGNIFHADVGELLGIDIESGQRAEFGGVTGVTKPMYRHQVEIIVGGWPYSVEVNFSYGISQFGYGVLGQKGFFDLFVVKFDYNKEQIELKPKHR